MLSALIAVSALFGFSYEAFAAPKRVVSMNLCTDQLAMLVGPDQLISVSYLAHDPRASAMAEEAKAYPANRGLAEEVFLLKPDLVIAGTFTTRATVDMLKRLGIPLAEFAPADSLDDVRARLAEMGDVLGRKASAAALIEGFDAELVSARSTSGPRPRAATYYANSYTSGAGTLASDVMRAAGLANVAAELGFKGGGRLPLESLVMADPDLIVSGRRYEQPAQADAVLSHPALHALQARAGIAPVADRHWICGTPLIIAAIERLVHARDTMLGN